MAGNRDCLYARTLQIMNYYKQFAYFFSKVKNPLSEQYQVHLGPYVFEMVIDMWSSLVNSYPQDQDAKQTSKAARSAEVESVAILLRHLPSVLFSSPIVPGKAWTLTANVTCEHLSPKLLSLIQHSNVLHTHQGPNAPG